MAPLNTKQKEVLEHEKRKAIFDFLQGCDKPAGLGAIAEGVGIRDLAIAHHQLNRLLEADLAEKVFGTNLYRVVGE